MTTKLEPFSVLMAVYCKDDPFYLNDALSSIYQNSLLPAELILVEDGPITDELSKIIDYWNKSLNIVRIKLENNLGLGNALNIGLKNCNNEIIIRVDADDLNREHRFLTQILYLKEHQDIQLLSSWVEEFEHTPGDKKVFRKVPPSYKLVNFSKKRSPFNHPSMAFRKSAVLSVGGYGNEHLYEDYALWMKLLYIGVKGDNIQDVLVDMRFSNDALKRRGGIKYAISELKAQLNFYHSGFISFPRLILNIATRIFVRVIPNSLRVFIYRELLRR
ncbi:glycosyltransferase [Hafnia paralvei]|uniref:UDP-gal:alpha-D-glcNac-diphosphoundecaprenol beta-1,3-galactosyltransferase n=1 Tax=Hafnia alvei TaxID=569 RepID=A0A172WZR4_HAFAL|nr:glycosyltransferase [Hafnia paralvei]ANF29865.1 UDP-gal:alpha-D-glcNac-diphosphoundecaprenol beta-1,3-galactosyltransferase [Hafnia alvei]